MTLEGKEVIGQGSKFTTEFSVGDSITIKGCEPCLITEIVSDEKLTIKAPMEDNITEARPYKARFDSAAVLF